MPGTGPAPRGGRDAGEGSLSPEEFAARYQESARILWTLAAGVLGSPAEAEDVLQEAAMTALQKLDEFRPGTQFAAWMGSFVRNVARNHARKRARRRTEPVDPLVLDSPAEGPSEGAPAPDAARLPIDERGELLDDRDAFDDELTQALRGLAPMPRACLLLRSLLGLEYREIAAVLGVPEGTAMSHVHRARTALRARLGAEDASMREPETRQEAR